jgi:polysaccharide biosynthesis protein PslH
MPKGMLFITNKLEIAPSGGRELLTKLHHDALADIYGEALRVIDLSKYPAASSPIKAFMGHIDGISERSIDAVDAEIKQSNIAQVFVDGSNLGELVKVLKQRFPDLLIYTFFHNVESRFFWGSFKQNKNLRSFAICAANYLAERKAVRYSDRIVCLSKRDSQLLLKLYGRSATDILPMALHDQRAIQTLPSTDTPQEKYALFVGGLFYANQAGITWFVNEVSPHIKIKTYIVGKGFEKQKDMLEQQANVKVIGAVASLAPWYAHAQFVIAPIFDGSGMKTKVAEALMFGKKIVGTPEAFSGYEDIAKEAGWVCSTRDEFVTAINEAQELITQPFDTALNNLYRAHYSFAAQRAKIKTITSRT